MDVLPVVYDDDLDDWRLLDWSPDGRWLAVRESIGREELWVTRDLFGDGEELGRVR